MLSSQPGKTREQGFNPAQPRQLKSPATGGSSHQAADGAGPKVPAQMWPQHALTPLPSGPLYCLTRPLMVQAPPSTLVL